MTLLVWQFTENSFEIAMDTLGKTDNPTEIPRDFFLEKVFFFERFHILMTMKGLANFGLEIAYRLKLKEPFFENKAQFFSYAEEVANITYERLSANFNLEESLRSTVTFFHFDSEKPFAFRIQKVPEDAKLVTLELEIKQNEILTSNDVNTWPKSAERYRLRHKFKILEVQKKNLLDYKYINLAINAHFNDPPETHVGGKIIRYTFSKEKFKNKTIFVFEDDVNVSEYLSMEQFLANFGDIDFTEEIN